MKNEICFIRAVIPILDSSVIMTKLLFISVSPNIIPLKLNLNIQIRLWI